LMRSMQSERRDMEVDKEAMTKETIL